MAEQAELAFVKNYVNIISAQPVTFADDFQQPPANSLKKVPVLPIDLPEPPERKATTSLASADFITITVKSTKPAKYFTLSVQPADTIATIKTQLASEPAAPPADVQRLLLKGKALADGKLLQEYGVKDGDTVNLMVKPGFHWDPTQIPKTESPPPATPAEPTPPEPKPENITLLPEGNESKTKRGHSRIPSVVLSPSPSLTPTGSDKIVDIPLILDTSNMPLSSSSTSDTPYHATLSQPAFWEKLHTFLTAEFPHKSDAESAWEDFFCASKGRLSVSEIANIRDKVGVIGMAGT